MLRRAVRGGLLLAVAVALGGLASTAMASPAGGTLYITDHQVDTHKEGWEKELKKVNKAALIKQGDAWHVFFVAYMKKAPGAPDVNLVFYSLAGGKAEEANAFPIQTQPTAKILMSDVQVATDTGIKPGKYEVRVTRLIDGKEEVYARTHLELK